MSDLQSRKSADLEDMETATVDLEKNLETENGDRIRSLEELAPNGMNAGRAFFEKMKHSSGYPGETLGNYQGTRHREVWLLGSRLRLHG